MSAQPETSPSTEAAAQALAPRARSRRRIDQVTCPLGAPPEPRAARETPAPTRLGDTRSGGSARLP